MPSHVPSVAAQSQNARAVRTAGNELPRRHLLTVTGATALGGASTAAAETTSSHPDAALLAMGEELMRAWTIERATPAETPEAERDAAYDACRIIVDRIAKERARTLEGLQVKALAFLWCGHEPGEEVEELFGVPAQTSDTKIALSIASDLARDVPAEVRTLAAWRVA